MEEKIEKFVYVNNPALSTQENLRLKNRSSNGNIIHQAVFNSIDEFAKQVIIDLHNEYSNDLFESNQLNIVSDEESIVALIEFGLKKDGEEKAKLANPEMIYRAFNFIKPPTLLPLIFMKLYLLKQKGVSVSGEEKNYVLNPFFFGFKISLDIYITSMFCADYSEKLEENLVNILTDKYGSEYREIYDYVSHNAYKFAIEGKRKGDQNDETFIAGVQSISGIANDKIFHDIIYESAMISSHQKIKFFKNL
jgi:hypothetical protein